MSLAAKKDVYGTFSNDQEWVQVVYDFSVDGGASTDFDILEAKEDLLCLNFYGDVQTAVTAVETSSSLAMDVGIGDGGTEFWSDKTTANLTLNAMLPMATYLPVKIASGSKVVMGIENVDATAGKIAFNFLIKKL